MTAAVAAAATVVRTPAEVRRARILGVVYLAMALFVLWAFGLGSEGNAIFRLAPTGASPQIDVTLPAAGTAYVVAAFLAFLGGIQLSRGLGKWTNLVLAGALVLFILTFLAWAAAGRAGGFSMVGMLKSTVELAAPITFGALSGVMCERVAVINIGIEGMLLTGAFVGAVVGTTVGSWAGVFAATASGAVLGWALAVLAIKYRVDQIIAGVVINIFALGLTSYLTSQLVVKRSDELNNAGIFQAFKIPLLGDIPIIGPILFEHNFFVYAMYILVASITYGLFRTRWGLRSRAVGEHPKAADTLGVNVFRFRYMNVILGGAIAGFGGAFFTLGSVGAFNENMTGGRGFIGLAAMIFGRWHPVGALGAALVFGFSDSLATKLAILDTPIPSEFLLMSPYIVTVVVVAGLVGKARPPAADGIPYVKE